MSSVSKDKELDEDKKDQNCHYHDWRHVLSEPECHLELLGLFPKLSCQFLADLHRVSRPLSS
jgi:hypothetical protein